jgi:hypothetical protein
MPRRSLQWGSSSPHPPAPTSCQAFTAASGHYAYCPTRSSCGRSAALASCRTWRPHAQLLWWDTWSDLAEVAAWLASSTDGMAAFMTGLSCHSNNVSSSSSAGSSSAGGSSATGAIQCTHDNGRRVSPDLLHWHSSKEVSRRSPGVFEPVLYVEAQRGGATLATLLLVPAPPAGLVAQVVCREPGGWRPASCVALCIHAVQCCAWTCCVCRAWLLAASKPSQVY